MASTRTNKTAKTSAKQTASLAPSRQRLIEAGYRLCDSCGRYIKAIDAHAAQHKSGAIGDDGKRTDRTKAEAKAIAEKWSAAQKARYAKPVKAPKSKKVAVAAK